MKKKNKKKQFAKKFIAAFSSATIALSAIPSLPIDAWAVFSTPDKETPVFSEDLIAAMRDVCEEFGSDADPKELLESMYSLGIIDENGELLEKIDTFIVDGVLMTEAEMRAEVANHYAEDPVVVDGAEGTWGELYKLLTFKDFLIATNNLKKGIEDGSIVYDEETQKNQEELTKMLQEDIEFELNNGERSIKLGNNVVNSLANEPASRPLEATLLTEDNLKTQQYSVTMPWSNDFIVKNYSSYYTTEQASKITNNYSKHGESDSVYSYDPRDFLNLYFADSSGSEKQLKDVNDVYSKLKELHLILPTDENSPTQSNIFLQYPNMQYSDGTKFTPNDTILYDIRNYSRLLKSQSSPAFYTYNTPNGSTISTTLKTKSDSNCTYQLIDADITGNVGTAPEMADVRVRFIPQSKQILVYCNDFNGLEKVDLNWSFTPATLSEDSLKVGNCINCENDSDKPHVYAIDPTFPDKSTTITSGTITLDSNNTSKIEAGYDSSRLIVNKNAANSTICYQISEDDAGKTAFFNFNISSSNANISFNTVSNEYSMPDKSASSSRKLLIASQNAPFTYKSTGTSEIDSPQYFIPADAYKLNEYIPIVIKTGKTDLENITDRYTDSYFTQVKTDIENVKGSFYEVISDSIIAYLPAKWVKNNPKFKILEVNSYKFNGETGIAIDINNNICDNTNMGEVTIDGGINQYMDLTPDKLTYVYKGKPSSVSNWEAENSTEVEIRIPLATRFAELIESPPAQGSKDAQELNNLLQYLIDNCADTETSSADGYRYLKNMYVDDNNKRYDTKVYVKYNVTDEGIGNYPEYFAVRVNDETNCNVLLGNLTLHCDYYNLFGVDGEEADFSDGKYYLPTIDNCFYPDDVLYKYEGYFSDEYFKIFDIPYTIYPHRYFRKYSDNLDCTPQPVVSDNIPDKPLDVKEMNKINSEGKNITITYDLPDNKKIINSSMLIPDGKTAADIINDGSEYLKLDNALSFYNITSKDLVWKVKFTDASGNESYIEPKAEYAPITYRIENEGYTYSTWNQSKIQRSKVVIENVSSEDEGTVEIYLSYPEIVMEDSKEVAKTTEKLFAKFDIIPSSEPYLLVPAASKKLITDEKTNLNVYFSSNITKRNSVLYNDDTTNVNVKLYEVDKNGKTGKEPVYEDNIIALVIP